MKLRPFFYFYGGKFRAVGDGLYPAPQHKTIVEPFAGSAGYSVRHYDRQIILNDVDPIIAGVWSYLIRVKPSELLRLPVNVNHVDEMKCCQEARWLAGFWFNHPSSTPKLQPSSWMKSRTRPKSHWGEEVKARLAEQVQFIRHWKISNASYASLRNRKATWFIDPPYCDSHHGRHYRFHDIDYEHLGEWCQSRRGQVIACESPGADWLPFREVGVVRSANGHNAKGWSRECVWTNDLANKRLTPVAASLALAV